MHVCMCIYTYIHIYMLQRAALRRESANVSVKVKTYTYSRPGGPADRPHPTHTAFIAASNGVRVASPRAAPTAPRLWVLRMSQVPIHKKTQCSAAGRPASQRGG